MTPSQAKRQVQFLQMNVTFIYITIVVKQKGEECETHGGISKYALAPEAKLVHFFVQIPFTLFCHAE